MKIIKGLYVGPMAVNDKKIIIKDLGTKSIQAGIYVLTLPIGDSNLLEIYPAFTLKFPIFREARRELTVIGIARGREEALSLSATIIQDVYNRTGGFNVRDFLE